MPIPSSPSTVQRPDLGFIVEEYNENVARDEFIGLSVMPLFESATNIGEWPVIRIDEQLRRLDTKRAIGAAYAQDDYTFDFDGYAVREYGAESPVYVEEAKAYKRYIQAETLAAQRAVTNLWRDYEYQVAQVAHDPNNAGSTLSAIAPWTDNAAVQIKKDIKAARLLMRYGDGGSNLGYGVRPNMLIVTEDVFLEIMDSDTLKDDIKQTTNVHELGDMQSQRALLSSYLDIEVKIAYPLLNTAPRGATRRLENLWPNNTALLLKASNSGMDMREAAFGRTILWTDDSPSMVTIEQYYKDENRKTMYRARHQVDKKVSFVGAMCHITGIAG